MPKTTKPEGSAAEAEFFFPTLGVTVKAASQEEAEAKARALTSNDNPAE